MELSRKMPLLRRRKSKLSRSEPVREERNVLRGHALFVRFLERRNLGDCVHYFPEDMTLGTLRKITQTDLSQHYGVTSKQHIQRLMTVIDEAHREDQSDAEVCAHRKVFISLLIFSRYKIEVISV